MKKRTILGLVIACALLGFLLVPNIYFIAGQLGIRLCSQSYQRLVNWVSAGGTLGGAFAAILGIAVPVPILAFLTGVGIASA